MPSSVKIIRTAYRTVIQLCQRKFLRRFGCDADSVGFYFVCFRIYRDLRCFVVKYHVFLSDVSAVFYRTQQFFPDRISL